MARAVPTTTYETPGALVTAGAWDNGPKALSDFLSNRPMGRFAGGLGQSVPSGTTWVIVQFTVTYVDTDSGHSSVTNNTRYTCQVPGWYWVKGCAALNPTGAGNVASRFDVAIAKNGATVVGASEFLTKGASVTHAGYASSLVQLAVNDYVEIWVRQFTGATQTLDANGFGTESDFNLLWVHS